MKNRSRSHMNNQTFTSIIWLRYQLLKRFLFNKKNLPLWLLLLFWFIFLGYLLITNGILTIIISIVVSQDLEILPGVLFGLLFFLSLGLFIYVLFIGMRLQDEITFTKMAFMPVKRFYFYVTESIAFLFDFWCLILLSFVLSIIFGLGLSSDPISLLASLILLICLLFFLGVFYQFCQHSLTYLIYHIGKGIFRTVFSFVLLLLFMLVIWSPLFLMNNDPRELSRFLTDLLYKYKLFLSPIGLIVDGFTNILDGQIFRIFLLHVPLLFVYTVLFLWLGYHISKGSEKRNSSTQRRYKPENNLIKKIDNLETTFRKRVSIIQILFAKEITYLVRSPRIILFILFGLVNIFMLNQRMLTADPITFIPAVIFLSAPSIFFIFDSAYVFSFDENAVRAYFFNPIEPDQMILSKNLGFLFLVLIFQFAAYGLSFIILGAALRFSIILSSLTLTSYLLVVNIITVNYTTVMNPKKLKYKAIFGHSSAPVPIMLSIFLSAIPVGICFFIFQHSESATLASLFVLFLIALAFYKILLPTITRKLLQNQENYINILAGH